MTGWNNEEHDGNGNFATAPEKHKKLIILLK